MLHGQTDAIQIDSPHRPSRRSVGRGHGPSSGETCSVSDKIKLEQRINDGTGNVLIGKVRKLVICEANSASTCPAYPAAHEDRMTTEQRLELTKVALQIEQAEEGFVDAATIWQAMCDHLNGRGLDNIGDNTELSQAQFWAARTYLDGWLACARGDNLPRNGMMREIMRMWGIRGGLRASTIEFCETRFRTRTLTDLTEPQLRAALWVTVADWRSYWAQQQSARAT